MIPIPARWPAGVLKNETPSTSHPFHIGCEHRSARDTPERKGQTKHLRDFFSMDG